MAVTFPRIFHDVHTKLHSIVGKQFVRHALFGAFAEAVSVNESTIAALCVLQVKLQSTITQVNTDNKNIYSKWHGCEMGGRGNDKGF